MPVKSEVGFWYMSGHKLFQGKTRLLARVVFDQYYKGPIYKNPLSTWLGLGMV